jgi:elongation factor Ts
MMDCKGALAEADGDVAKAKEVLQKKGLASVEKRAGRAANQGLIDSYIHFNNTVGVLVEVNCETDFVAKNDSFRAFSEQVAAALASDPQADLEARRVEEVAKIGENIKISRSHRLEVAGVGMVAAYIHTGAKVGVLVEVGAGKESTVAHDAFKQFVRDVTLQVAAASPLAVGRDQIDSAVVAKEREIAADQVKNKPPQAIAKIVEGKLEKFFQTVCLLDQGFLKRDSEVTVKEHLAGLARELGDEIAIRRFVRFQVGEAAAA